MTDPWPIGPYLVLEPTQNPFDFKKIPAGSEFEAKQIADRLSEVYRTEIGVYKWVADDEAYVLMGPKPPLEFTVCEPVPIAGSPLNKMTCRRGTGSRSVVQGQPAPKCDGILKPVEFSDSMHSCDKCGLLHATVVVDGETRYGFVL